MRHPVVEAGDVIAGRADPAQLDLAQSVALLEGLYGVPGGKEVVANEGDDRLVLLYRRPASGHRGRREILQLVDLLVGGRGEAEAGHLDHLSHSHGHEQDRPGMHDHALEVRTGPVPE